MDEYIKFKTLLFKYHFIFSVIILSFFYSLSFNTAANGYILGAFVSVINFYLLSKTNERITFFKDRFNSYSIKWFFLRYLLYALALIASLKKEYFSLGGAVIGLISMQMVIFSLLILGRLKE